MRKLLEDCRVYANKTVPLLLIEVALASAGVSRAAAADVEVRDFTIQVDGKHAGDYRMTIERKGDGSVTLTAQSDVQVKVLVVPVYTYTYRGLEVWKDGRLLRFASSGKENSKAFTVNADAAGNGLRVKANGQEHTHHADVWTTSCWRLPDARYRNQSIPLMGCDNGQESTGHLQFVGNEKITIAGRERTCTHYRLMNKIAYELWYDEQDCLLRHEWVSDGHRTLLELSRITHGKD